MDNKAQVKIIETIVIISLVFYFSSMMNVMKPQVKMELSSDLILKDFADSALLALEQSGLLYKSAVCRNFEMVFNVLSAIMPQETSFNLVVVEIEKGQIIYSKAQPTFDPTRCSSSSFTVLNMTFILEVSKS